MLQLSYIKSSHIFFVKVPYVCDINWRIQDCATKKAFCRYASLSWESTICFYYPINGLMSCALSLLIMGNCYSTLCLLSMLNTNLITSDCNSINMIKACDRNYEPSHTVNCCRRRQVELWWIMAWWIYLTLLGLNIP